MQKEHKSLFIEYLQAKHHERLQAKVLGFLLNNRSLIQDRLPLNYNLKYIHLEDLDYQYVYLENKGTERIEFDVIVVPEIVCDVYDVVYRDMDVYSPSSIWLSVTCSAFVRDTLENFRILGVSEYSKKKSEKPLADDLVPIIYKKEYDAYAAEFLETYYPEAFGDQFVGPINVRLIAERMGISIIERSISDNGTIFGQAVFSSTSIPLFNRQENKVEEVYIPSNTLIVDTEATAWFSFGSKHFTVVHELIHFYLHRKAFNFARILNEELSFLQCQTDGGLRGETRDAKNNWMEIQANGIAPCILMPKHLVLHYVDVFMSIYKNKGYPILDIADMLIHDIANTFETSIYSTKKRLLELGFDFVGGALNWVDGHYVPSYLYNKESLAQDETYTVSVKDVYRKAFEGGITAVLLAQGNFSFIENHLCIDSPKYIESDGFGKSRLTEYARLHIDECCVKFKCRPKDVFAKNSTVGAWCYLSQDFNANIFGWELEIAENDKLVLSPEFPSKRREFTEHKNLVMSKIENMSFGDGLKYLLSSLNVSQEYLAIEADLDDHTISRYCTGKSKSPTKRTVIAICVALRLPAEITITMLHRAGIVLRRGDADDDMLDFVIRSMRNQTVKQINKLLKESGFEPLTKEKK